jgi:hypothetical protein
MSSDSTLSTPDVRIPIGTGFQLESIADWSVVFLCAGSFALSWIESVINCDSHHWGFMYVPAFDFKQGLVPYKQIFIAYGYLTTWIQALSLTVLGNSLKSIGIVTGLSYSLSLFLSYRVFLAFLSKPLSAFSVFLIFLIHPYIVHPWPNYFSYTVQLICLLLFIKATPIAINRFAAGVCLGLACLFRYSSAVAIVPPFVIYLCYEAFLIDTQWRLRVKGAVLFGFGILAPLLWFVGLLISDNTYSDFYIQNRVIAESWNRGITVRNFLPTLLKHIALADTWPERDTRSVAFSITFFVAAIAVGYLGRKILLKRRLSQTESSMFIVSLVAVFGFFNSIHMYQIFRLINSVSIGIGLVIYVTARLASRPGTVRRRSLIACAVIVCLVWSSNLLFRRTSSINLPWDRSSLARPVVTETKVTFFEGKRLSKEYYCFYDEVLGIFSKFDRSYYVINYTWDPLLTVLGGLKRVQIVPFYLDPPYYLPIAEDGYPEETRRIADAISSRKAIVLTTKERTIPGYKVVFAKPWSEDTPWFARLKGMKLYVNIPDTPTGQMSRRGRLDLPEAE